MTDRSLERRVRRNAIRLLPGRVRRLLPRRSAGLQTGPDANLVSLVVVCEPVDAPRLADCLASIRAQTHSPLEVLLCPVGGVVEEVGRAAADDPRMRVLPATTSWHDAANHGAQQAGGALLGFVRGCDLLPPTAVADLAAGLAGSGSAMATGRLVQRGQPEEWLERAQRAAHRRPGRGLAPVDRPALAGDLAIGNRLIRTTHWRAGSFAFTHDDEWLAAPTIAAVLVHAAQVDVLAKPVYEFLAEHGNRPFASTPSPLPELPRWRRRAELVERALEGSPLRKAWLRHVLDIGLPRFLKDAERATDGQWADLVAGTAAYQERAGAALLAEVRAESRAILWLTEQGRRSDVEALAAESARLGDDLPTVLRGSNLLACWESVAGGLPEEVRRLTATETPLKAVAQRVRRVDGDREADIFVTVAQLDLAAVEPVIEVALAETGAALGPASTPDPAATRWAQSRFHSAERGAVRVRVPGTDPVVLRILLTAGELVRSGTLVVPAAADRAAPSPVVIHDVTADGDGLLVTLDGDPDMLRLVDAAEQPIGRPVGGPGQVRLALRRDWFGRTTWLPSGAYRLVTDQGNVGVAPELSGQLPREWVGEQHRVRVHLGPHGGLVIGLGAPLGDDELGPYAQTQLRSAYAASDRPVDPELFYFESYAGRSATDSPLAIFNELRRRRPDLRAYWGVADHSQCAPEGSVPVLLRSRAWYDVLARAGCLVVNTEFDEWFRRRPGQVVVQTFHGHPSKTMGEGLWRSKQFSPSQIAVMRARSVDTWDAIVTPSPEMTRHYREQYGYAGVAFEHGYPRDDDLHGPGAGVRRAATRRLLGIRDDQTAVLYAPTWREHLATRPRAAAMADFLDADAVAASLGDSHVLLLRGHRFHTPRLGGPGIVDVTGYPEVNDLILASDVAVLDYSSLRFDYGQTGKPMVFLVPDLDEYDGGLRGFLFPFADSAPGPFVQDTAGVVAEVRDIGALRSRYAEDLAAFDATYNRWQDGQASARVAEGLLEWLGSGYAQSSATE
jgi:CDP-glycerol glycerophosphotransferase (TagB/SpsB family)